MNLSENSLMREIPPFHSRLLECPPGFSDLYEFKFFLEVFLLSSISRSIERFCHSPSCVILPGFCSTRID